METEGGGLAVAFVPERGYKRPPSPPTLSDDGDGSKPSDDDGDGSKPSDDDDEDDGEWLVSGSEEDEDHEDQGTHPPYTVDDIPRPGCDHEKQSDVMFRNPDVKLRGPLPIRLFPAFKGINIPILEWPRYMGLLQRGKSLTPCGTMCTGVRLKIVNMYLVKRKTGVARLSLTSPARVISMEDCALIEFEIHARSEDETTAGDDDLIIEGCTLLESMFTSSSSVEHRRLYGERCALDIKYMLLIGAVEAWVEVTVLRLGSAIPSGVYMKLYTKTSGFSEVILLFRGAAPESGTMMTFAVAVECQSGFDHIEGSPRDDSISCQKLRPYMWEGGFASSFPWDE